MEEEIFKIGDYVSLKYFDFSGKIVSINDAPKEVMKFFSDDNSLLKVYKIEIEDNCFITTTEDGIELIKPERVSE